MISPFQFLSKIVSFPVLYISIMVSFIFTSCSFSNKQSKCIYKKASENVYDVIVVPGVPLEDGKWSFTMKGRILWSKYLYEKGIAKNIIYSGAAVYSPYREGEIMALYAIAMGIPEEHVFRETRAEHSTENIYYGYRLARSLGYKKIALASDRFQTRMLKRYIRKKVNSEIAIIPMVDEYIKSMNVPLDPDIAIDKALVPDFISITDRESFWKRLRGTRGLNVDTTAYPNH